MEIADTVKKILQEVIVPEIGKIKDENSKILAVLEVTNKRLDDINLHLADQSRRIDEINNRIDEINNRIDETNNRIDETNKRIDETNNRIDETNNRIDETNQRVDDVRSELSKRIEDIHSDLVKRLDANNERIDRFFLTAATKEDYARVEGRLTHLEREIDHIKQRLAA